MRNRQRLQNLLVIRHFLRVVKQLCNRGFTLRTRDYIRSNKCCQRTTRRFNNIDPIPTLHTTDRRSLFWCLWLVSSRRWLPTQKTAPLVAFPPLPSSVDGKRSLNIWITMIKHYIIQTCINNKGIKQSRTNPKYVVSLHS